MKQYIFSDFELALERAVMLVNSFDSDGHEAYETKEYAKRILLVGWNVVLDETIETYSIGYNNENMEDWEEDNYRNLILIRDRLKTETLEEMAK